MAKSHFCLHLVISFILYASWLVSVVYNDQRIKEQRNLSGELLGITNLNLSQIIIGDFNFIISSSERCGGSFASYSQKSSLFSNFITSNLLLDISFIWCNGQLGLARRWAILDCCLVNPVGVYNFRSYTLNNFPKVSSDHSTLLTPKAKYFSLIIIGLITYSATIWLWRLGISLVKLLQYMISHLEANTRSRLIQWRVFGMNSLESDLKDTKLKIRSLEQEDRSTLFS